MVKFLRRFVEEPRAIDATVAVLSTWFVLGAYVMSFAYVHEQGHVIEPARTAGFTFLTAAWSLLTLYLFAGFALGLREGRPWNRALPDGETGTFMAALIFGSAWIVDAAFYTPIAGTPDVGLDTLFTPPHLVEMAAAAVIVSGPLRAAARRGETEASPVTLTSAALLLSVVTFATQFVHPLVDPWGMSAYEFRASTLKWIGENIGVGALLAQTAILAASGLLLNSAFKLRPGSLTFVFALNGALVCVPKLHFEMIAVPIVAGVAGDAWVAWTSRQQGKPSASLTAILGATYTLAYMTDIALHPGGTSWAPSLWAGTTIAVGMLCWLMGRTLRAGLPGALFELYPTRSKPAEVPTAEEWTVDPASVEERLQMVHTALVNLDTPEALGRSPLMRLPGVSGAADLRELLVDGITEIANSKKFSDSQAGHLMLDYYVKRVGSHDVVRERLHVSRPVYYVRLKRGFALLAMRLDDIRVPSPVPVA